jgi:hypothetical protein
VTQKPTREEIAAAIETIMRGWVPTALAARLLPDDYDDGTNGCGCGCRNCEHFRQSEAARCQLVVPVDGHPYARCGQPTRYRIRPYCTHRGSVSRPSSTEHLLTCWRRAQAIADALNALGGAA